MKMEQENHPLEGALGDLELKAREVRVNLIAGNEYLRQKWYSGAESCFYQALHLQPDNLEAHFGMGQIHLESGAYDKAAKRFQKVLDINPGYEKVQELYTLALEGCAKKGIEYLTPVMKAYEANLENTVN